MSDDGLLIGSDGVARCWWCGEDPEYQRYHDEEWGRPVDDDRRLFEKLSLEAFQSGLSWITILRKRDNFRAAFDDFDVEKIAGYGADEVERLMNDAGIVRNRKKIEAVINNAIHLPAIVEEFGSFAEYVWRFEPSVETRPERITKERLYEHTTSPESKAFARDLKKRGFRFVGPTTAYAFMQAMGLVNDHLDGCTSRTEVEALRSTT